MPIINTTCRFCSAPLVRKQSSSMHFCGTKCKSEWQKLAKPVSEEWLRNAYITQGLDCTKIGKIVQRDPKTVWNWLKSFGIPTRKRGTTGNHVFSIGAPRILSEEGRKKLSDQARKARSEDGRVPYLKDGKHWLHHEGAVSPNWKGGITPERQKVYSSQEWKDAVKEVWKRDKFCCVRCGVDLRCKKKQCAIHHIESFKNKEKRTDVTNLVLLCKTCHLWVHSKKNTDKEFIYAGD